MAVLVRTLGRVSEPQLQLFFLLQTVIARFAAELAPERLSRLTDADVGEAAGALAGSIETAGRGVLYEHRAESAAAEALRRELKAVIERTGRGGGARFDRDAAAVLRGIERGARHESPGLGAGPTEYLSLVTRILQHGPGADAASTRIIVPS
jgi:hypothetical protein